MNQVALVGNITDDPELRYTQSGAALAGFTVAVSHRSKHNGEWQDVNDGFFRCTAWRSVDSLLWVGAPADEPLFRGNASCALRDAHWLPALLDRVIHFDEKQRFVVQRDAFVAGLKQDGAGDAAPDLARRTLRLSEASRRKLGDELRATKLPPQQGLLVVVTTIQSLQKMTDAGIWRGLARGTRSEYDWDT